MNAIKFDYQTYLSGMIDTKLPLDQAMAIAQVNALMDTSELATKSDLRELKDELCERMDARFDKMDDKFDKVNDRIDAMSDRFGSTLRWIVALNATLIVGVLGLAASVFSASM